MSSYPIGYHNPQFRRIFHIFKKYLFFPQNTRQSNFLSFYQSVWRTSIQNKGNPSKRKSQF